MTENQELREKLIDNDVSVRELLVNVLLELRDLRRELNETKNTNTPKRSFTSAVKSRRKR